ncbi:MAG: recombinase family protein [Candidatus Dehalobacter alkaniphilus]
MESNANQTSYNAALYARLSKEDNDKEESDSIANQKTLIKEFLKSKPDIHICTEMVDDGYSGVDFNRPAMNQLLADIKAGLINCVIVKDLSRFGRNHIEVGRYIEQIFPFLGVRFISINDNYDSATGRTSADNIMLPFKNLMNDAYLGDISLKTKSQLEIKRKKGDFIGSFPVYGYLKSKQDRHKLVIDEYASQVVRDIFKWKLDGMSNQGIADKLNSMGILSPLEYKKSLNMKYTTTFKTKNTSKWFSLTIARIIKNEVYTGVLEQGKAAAPNHKLKKRIKKAKADWTRVENTHEPIVCKEDFGIVNKLLLSDTRIPPEQDGVYLLSGILHCGDCSENMVRKLIRRNGKDYVYYICSTYKKDKSKCHNHRISHEQLETGILEALQKYIGEVVNIDEMLRYIETLPLQRIEAQKIDKRLVKLQKEIDKCNRVKLSLYENYMDGIISRTEYMDMKHVYSQKAQEAERAAKKLQGEIETLMQNSRYHSYWIERFKEYRNIEELTRKALVTMIDHIIVIDAKRIDVHYKYQIEFDRAVAFIEATGQLAIADHATGKKVV